VIDYASATGVAQADLEEPRISDCGLVVVRGPVAVKGHLQQMDLATVLKPYVSRGTVQGDFMHRWDSAQAPMMPSKGKDREGRNQGPCVERLAAGTSSIPAHVRPHTSRARLP